MKRLIIVIMCMLLSTGLFAKQYVMSGFNPILNTIAETIKEECENLIKDGYHIDIITMYKNSYVIVYSK